MKPLAVLTSGGDAPGMNAAIRAAVRSGVAAVERLEAGQHGILLGIRRRPDRDRPRQGCSRRETPRPEMAEARADAGTMSRSVHACTRTPSQY